MLPDHLLHELRYIEIYTGRRFPNLRAGAYRSRLRGSGFDFDEHRLYRPGDDVRRIDWNVTARMQSPHVRETHADRDLNVVIAVDVSPSMQIGTGGYSKKELMLLLSGCLVFSALADQMNIGFLIFNDRVLDFAPPRRNRSRAWRFLEDLWALPADRTAGSRLLPAVRHLDSHFPQEGMVFLISDFMYQEDLREARELKMLAMRHDVVGVVIEDPIEARLPGSGAVIELQDVESGVRRRVSLSRKQRQEYAAAMQQRRRSLVETFYHVPMDHVFVRSDEHTVESMLNLFSVRKRA